MITAASRRCAELDQLAQRVVDPYHAAPCAVVACAYLRAGHWHIDQGAFGRITFDGPLVDIETLFDLASVSKPFVAVSLARLFRSELIAPDTPLGVLVREALGTPSAKVTLELLLAHRSGLHGHRPLYAPLEQGRNVDRFQALVQAAQARRAECQGDPPSEGFAPTYSDLGYLLMGEAISRASSLPLECVVQREVCTPLGLQVRSARQWLSAARDFEQRVAPTVRSRGTVRQRTRRGLFRCGGARGARRPLPPLACPLRGAVAGGSPSRGNTAGRI